MCKHVVDKEGEKEREIDFKELAYEIVRAGEEDVRRVSWKPGKS